MGVPLESFIFFFIAMIAALVAAAALRFILHGNLTYKLYLWIFPGVVCCVTLGFAAGKMGGLSNLFAINHSIRYRQCCYYFHISNCGIGLDS